MDHGSRLHAEYGASSRYRRKLCPGSVRMARSAPPSTPSEWAIDGTEAHELLDFAFKNGLREAEVAAMCYYEYKPKPDAELEKDRLRAVQMCLDYVYGIIDTYADFDVQAYFEEEVQFDSKAAPSRVFGTGDVILYVPALGLYFIIDYKHGAGLAVDGESNDQTAQYAVMAAQTLTPTDKDIIAEATIVQPRAYHAHGPIRSQTFTPAMLVEEARKIEAEIEACEDPNAPLVPGETQCHWCPAGTICPVRHNKALANLPSTTAVVSSFRDVNLMTLAHPKTLDDAALAQALAARSFVKDYFDDLANEAYERAMNGGHIPGYKLVDAQSKRRWYGNEYVIAESIMKLTGCDIEDIYPRKLIGIVDAETLIASAFKEGGPKRAAKELTTAAKVALSDYTTRDNGGKLTLVDDTDRRPAVSAQVNFVAHVQLPHMRD